MVLSVSPGFAQPYPNTTNTNRPVFTGPTNLSGRVGESFFHQILIGGTGRGWVGSELFSNGINPERWQTTLATNGGLVSTNSTFALRSTSTNRLSPAQGELAWVPPLPLDQSWLAYARCVVPANLAVTNGQSALAYLRLFQSNRPAGTVNLTNFSQVGWGRGFSESVSNTILSSFRFQNTPYVVTNFSSNQAAFFTNAAGSTRAALVFSNFGTSNAPTNRLAYRATTNGSLTAGMPGAGAALAMPALLLPRTNSWEVTATVNLDPSRIMDWDPENPDQGFSIGLNLVKHFTNQTPLQMMSNRVAFGFLWQANGGQVGRAAFSRGTNTETGTGWIVGSEGQLNAVRLRLSYDATTQLLSTAYEDPEFPMFGWIPTDDDLSLDTAGSLGGAWSTTPDTGFFRLILSAENDYAVYDDEAVVGSGNTVSGQEVPVYFSDLSVVVQPEDRVHSEVAGSLAWLILNYDAATRELTQAFATDETNPESLEGATISLNAWATNAPLQLRLGASAAQTNYPANSIHFATFSVVPGVGQLSYSLLNAPPGFDIDDTSGYVTAPSLDAAGNTNFTVVASNPASGLTATQTFRLNIGAALPQLAVTASNLPLRYGVTNSNALVVAATNTAQLGTNPVTFSVSPNPAVLGLSFSTNSNSLTLRGTPIRVTAGTNLVISASNVAGVARLTSSISIEPAVPRLQLLQNRPNPRYSLNVSGWSNAYWTVRVSNSLGQNAGAYPNIITVEGLPEGFNFRTAGAPVSADFGSATNSGIISLATNQATNAGVFTNVVFTVTNISGSSTLTSTITVLPSVPVLALVTNEGGAVNSGSATNPVFANLAFGSSNSNWFQISNTVGGAFPTTYSMQGAPRGLTINSSSGVVSGAISQAVNASNVMFRAQNQSGPSQVLRMRISTLPPGPGFTVVTAQASNGVARDVLTATITNFANMGTNLIQWSTTATNATNSEGNLGNFSLTTNANRSVFTIRTTANSTNAGIFSNITVTASSGGGSNTVTTNLIVLPQIPALLATSNTEIPPQFGEESTNGLMVTVTNLPRQNLTEFPVTFTVSNSATDWTLNTNTTEAWLSSASPSPTNASVRFTASNAAGSFSTNLTLRVLPLAPAITVTTNSNRLQFGSANSTNHLTLEVDSFGQNTNPGQFPVSWSIGTNRPPGVTLTFSNNALTNFLGGTNPSRAGVFNGVEIVASNAAGVASVAVDLTVYPQLPQIRVTTNAAQFNVTNSNSVSISVTNANPSNSLGLGADGFGISFTSTNPPASLAFTSTNGGTNALMGGVPDVATNVTFAVVVSNLSGAVTSSVNLRILPAAPQISVQTNNAPFQFGVTNTNGFVISVTNGAGQNTNDWPITFTSTNLPVGGWTITPTTGTNGVIGSSSPNAILSNNITVLVSNAGGTFTTNLVLRVLPGLVSFNASNVISARYGTNYSGIPSTNFVAELRFAGASQNHTIYPVSYTATNLPPGLFVTNTAAGFARVLGTPTNAGRFTNARIFASNAAGISTNTLSLTCLPAAPLFTVATARAQANSNSPSVLVVTVTNTNANRQNTTDFPLQFSVTPAFPSGLAFTNTNPAGLIATAGGTPGAGSATNITNLIVQVSHAGGTSTVSTNLKVLPALPELAALTSGTIQWGVSNSNAIRVSVTNLAFQNTNNFPLTFTASNLPTNSGWRLTGAGNTSGVIGNTNPTLATNVTNLLVTASNEAGAASTNLTLRVLPAAPQLSLVFTNTNNLRYGSNVGTVLTVTVVNTNGGAQNTNDFPGFGYELSSAPDGLAFTNTNGIFSAVAGSTNLAQAFSNTVTLRVTNAGGTNTTNFTLRVLPAPPELEVATAGTVQFGVSNGSAITIRVTNSSGQNTNAYPLTFTASNLPTSFGWALTKVGETSGVIGSPNPTRATNVTNLLVTVANAGGTNSTNLNLKVLPLAPTNFVYTYGTNTTNRFRAGQTNVFLTLTIAPTGQNTADFPITFTGDPMTLPPGLDLTTTGVLSGRPELASTYQSVFTAENEAGSGISTNTIVVFGGAPEIVGPTIISRFSNSPVFVDDPFRYQVSARGYGQTWAGRDHFEEDLTNHWSMDGMTAMDADFSTNVPGYLQYVWSSTNDTFVYLQWKEPLPLTGWVASATVNFYDLDATNITSLTALDFENDLQYLDGGLAVYKDGLTENDFIGTYFSGTSNRPSGFASAEGAIGGVALSNGVGTNPIGVNTSSFGYAWIGLQATNAGGTNRLHSLGKVDTNGSPIWNTNLVASVNSWSNAAGTNNLTLRLFGRSMAPTNAANVVLEISDFVVVPVGDLRYSASNLPPGLQIDTHTGLIFGTPTNRVTNTATITISNSLGITNLTIDFDVR